MTVSEICQMVIAFGFLTTSAVLCLSVRQALLLGRDLTDLCERLFEAVERLEDLQSVRRCRVCGCTDAHACADGFGDPCHWVESDLCSQCARSRFAFCPTYTDPDGPQEICLVVEGLQGYYSTSMVASNFPEAEELCDRLNRHAGMDRKKADALVARSMGLSEPGRETADA